jgi:rhodanese-related sulfurtransferase
MVKAAKAEITTLSPAEAKARADAGDALLVDIRDIRELSRDGRIPGAFHAPRGMLEFWVAPDSPYHKPQLTGETPIILFCASAWRSALSTKTLQDMGLEGVAEIEGGFTGWRDEGLPIDKDE